MNKPGIARGRSAAPPPPMAERAAELRRKREEAREAPPEVDDLAVTVQPRAQQVPVAQPVAPTVVDQPAAEVSAPAVVADSTPAPVPVEAPATPVVAPVAAPAAPLPPTTPTAPQTPVPSLQVPDTGAGLVTAQYRSPALPLSRNRDRFPTRTITFSKATDEAVKTWRRARLAEGPGYTLAAMFIAAVTDLPTTVEEAQALIAITPDEVFDGGREQSTGALPDEAWQRVTTLAENIRIDHKQLQVPPWMVHAAAINRQLLAEGLGLGWQTY